MKFKIQIDWTLLWAGLIGLAIVWLYAMGTLYYRNGELPHDWLQAAVLLLCVGIAVSVWHFLALLVRAARWHVASRMSRAAPPAASPDPWPRSRIGKSSDSERR